MEISIGHIILSFTGYILVLYLVHEIFRRYLLLTTIFLFLTILTYPFWIGNLHGWYSHTRSFLVLVPLIFLNFVRLSYATNSKKMSFLRKRTSFWILYFVVVLNILLGSIQDYTIDNYYNAIAGLILAVTLPLPTTKWNIDTDRYNHHDFIVDLPLAWCLLYITWVSNIIYGGWIAAFGGYACLLAVTLIPVIIYKSTDLWLSTRVYTYSLYLIISFTLNYTFPVISPFKETNSKVQIIWAFANLILLVMYAFWWFQKGRRTIKEKIT